eukprot:scaffold14381_cov73-Isochrysis_galbana.AAC.1
MYRREGTVPVKGVGAPQAHAHRGGKKVKQATPSYAVGQEGRCVGGRSDHVVDDRRANDDAGHGEDAARPDEVGNGQALSGEDDRVGRVSRGEHEGEGARHRGGEQEQER